MYKFVVLFALVAVACAAPKPGYVASPVLVQSAPVVAAPVVHSVHSVPVATSHASTYKVDHKSYVAAPAVAYHAAPAVSYHAAPVAYSAHPVPLAYAAHASPLAYVH
ncbi:larval cuticle protein F1-like [Diachasmimorpha longicaudata]|uniref:larval cuticle protein F1-like n=1 Tax=Diachasmimorpha longicaudata TaxID=58733 RepID=UPI0030B8ACDE